MSFIKTTGEKKLMLFAGRAHPELAESVGEYLGIELTPTTAYDFANGEIFVRYKESVRGCDAFVLQSHAAPLNKWLMEQFIMVDALGAALGALALRRGRGATDQLEWTVDEV